MPAPPPSSTRPVVRAQPTAAPVAPAVPPLRAVYTGQAAKEAKEAKEQRVRVSVQPSVRDPTLLVVRSLAEGQSAPPGTREAFLVMADGRAIDLAPPSRSIAQ
jgi:hypothetical protein